MNLSKSMKSVGLVYLCSMFLTNSHAVDISTASCNTLTGSLAATLKLSYDDLSAKYQTIQNDRKRAKAFEDNASKSFEEKMAKVRQALDKTGLLSEWQNYLKVLNTLSGDQKKNFQAKQGDPLARKIFSALKKILPVTASVEMPKREKDAFKNSTKIDVKADLSDIQREGLEYFRPYTFLESPSIRVDGIIPAGVLSAMVEPYFFVLGDVNLMSGQSGIYLANKAGKASEPVAPLPTYPEFIAYQLRSNGLWADYQKCLSAHHITDPAWISAKKAKPASPDIILGIEHLDLPLNANKNRSAE